MSASTNTSERVQFARAIAATVVAAIVLLGFFAWYIDRQAARERAQPRQALHAEVREIIIKNQLAELPAAVVVLGDSITEFVRLPGEICGHQVVNAGIGGMSVTNLAAAAPRLFALGQDTLIVVAAGSNDFYMPVNATFTADYAALLKALTPLGRTIALANLTPIYEGSLSKHFDAAVLPAFNAAIAAAAKQSGLVEIDLFGALQAVEGNPTVDGAHPNLAGSRAWVAAMTTGIEKALGCAGRGFPPSASAAPMPTSSPAPTR